MKTIIILITLSFNANNVATLPEEFEMPKRKISLRSNKFHK